jgi:formylmethanofuran dehydrogenase subunit A
MAMLMSKKMREGELERVSPFVQKASNLPAIDVEKSLEEVIHMTRSLPARVLGLPNKGHLGVGADADIAIYDLNPLEVDTSNDFEKIYKAFKTAVYTIKDGNILVKDGEMVDEYWGKTYWVDARGKADMEAIKDDLNEFFSKYYTVELQNYGVEERWLKKPERIVI